MSSELDLIKTLNEELRNPSPHLTKQQAKSIKDIEVKLGKKIPSIVKAILVLSEENAHTFTQAFLGYEPLDVSLLFAEYFKKDKGSFLSLFKVDENYNVQAEKPNISADENGMKTQPILIENLNNYLPIAEFQGEYIIFDLSSNNYGRIILFSDFYNGMVLAPSLEEYLSDLESGLQENVYFVDAVDGALVYPSFWYQKRKVRSGQWKMDEYGEIIQE